jgi:CheY-like chemotaxis protein
MDFSDYLVMIIDDEAYYRQSVAAAVNYTLGAEIIEMDDGNEAYHYLKSKTKPELILLDINMPVMDGFQFLEKIRADREFKEIYVIPYTQNNDEKTVKRLVQLGIQDYIVKGMDLEKIINKIRKGLLRVKFGGDVDAIK